MKKILLFLCFLLVSCGKGDKLNVYTSILDKKFAKIERKGEIRIKETDDNFIGIISRAELYNEWLVILDRVQSKIHFIRRDGSIERSFGKKGKGPGEMVDPTGFTISKDGKVFVYDDGMRKIFCFNIDGRFLYSFAPPSDLMAGNNIKSNDGKLYIDILESRYANLSERWKSRAIGVFDLQGNLLNLFGVHDEIAKTFTYGATTTWFDFDRFGNVYSVNWKTYRIYKYDRSYKLVKIFGVQGKFRLPKEDIPWNLPFPEISKRLMKSSATESIIVFGDYVCYQFYDLTEETVRTRNPLYSRYYLKVYDLDGNYIPSDIELPGMLLDIDDEGRLYIYESDEPGNKVIGIYELRVVDK